MTVIKYLRVDERINLDQFIVDLKLSEKRYKALENGTDILIPEERKRISEYWKVNPEIFAKEIVVEMATVKLMKDYKVLRGTLRTQSEKGCVTNSPSPV